MEEQVKTNELKNEEYLTNQIITYLGNKRSLLGFIEEVPLPYQNKEIY